MNGTLFDKHSTPLARPTDPATSKEAAEAIEVGVVLGAMQAVALELVRRNPNSTGRELDLIHWSDGQIHKRLKELEKLGKIKRNPKRLCKVSGRPAATWAVI